MNTAGDKTLEVTMAIDEEKKPIRLIRSACINMIPLKMHGIYIVLKTSHHTTTRHHIKSTKKI